MNQKPVDFAALFLLMLTTGVFWGTWFTLTRTMDAFSAVEFVHIGKVIIANVATPMAIIMPACILLMVMSVWLYPDKKQQGYYFGWVAIILIALVLLITLFVLVPIDNDIKTWQPETVPGDLPYIRRKWETFHAIRTFVALASFGSFVAYLLWRPGKANR